uniref:Uncharacterized protein n=1 Tax=Anguilla anguilla TaxID=7936 RepID=A0A0E9WE02_ANGAN
MRVHISLTFYIRTITMLLTRFEYLSGNTFFFYPSN